MHQANSQSMRSRLSKRRIIGIAVSVLFLFSAIIFTNQPKGCRVGYRNDKTVRLSTLAVISEVVDTNQSRQTGLSGRSCIPPNTGMLFVFDNPDLHGFWMKDMKFSIDIVWLDQDKRVVDIKQDVSPATYPEVFYPSGTAKYVLETNPGLLESVDVTIGSQLSW